MALREIAENTDLVLVIGDQKSSNSNRLREVAEKRGVRAFLINGKEEIQPEWLQQVKTIALTAGASTPEDIVQECIGRLMELGVADVEDVIYTEENVVFQLPREVALP
jgi:4-hydroxy-3-methylbut-2-enyl diphosphate reductase